MTAWAPAAEAASTAVPRKRSKPKPAPPRRTAKERSLAGGVLWIVLLAALLAGIVALNVAVLRLNMQLEQLARERAELRAHNAELASRISSSAAAPKIETIARSLGLVRAEPADTTYVELTPER